jgi:hypothetical protein
VDRMMQRIQEKVDTLHAEVDKLLRSLQGFGWEDSRPEKEPEREVDVLEELVFTQTVPARARIPQDFIRSYHEWYAASLALIEANMPSRLSEFNLLHYGETGGKTEGVHHLLTRGWIDFEAQTEIARRIIQMDAIVASLPKYLEGRLFDLELEVAYLYVNDQLDEAEGLLKAKFTRAAGAIAGVLLERHLRLLCDKHRPPIKYPPKRATIALLNDRLRDNSVYDVAQWRKVQWMGDVRNKCSHAGIEPEATEVADLIA